MCEYSTTLCKALGRTSGAPEQQRGQARSDALAPAARTDAASSLTGRHQHAKRLTQPRQHRDEARPYSADPLWEVQQRPLTCASKHNLFVIGTDNRVYSTWWDGATGWAGWFNVSGGIGQASGQVAAISRVTEHIDLFVAGTDGLVYSTWWAGATGWAGWFQLGIT